MHQEIAYTVVTKCKTQGKPIEQKYECFHCKCNTQRNVKIQFASLLA